MKSSRRQRGFTLPEVLVAVAVFGIASTGLVATVLMNVRSNRVSKEISDATTWAQSIIDYERSQPITASTSACPNSWGSVPNIYTVSCSLGTAGQLLDGSTGPPGIRPLTVTLSWTDFTSRSVTLRTYVTY